MNKQTVDKLYSDIRNQSGQPFDAIDQWSKDSQLDNLKMLAQRLIDNWEATPSLSWQFRSCLTRILENLALTAGQPYVEALFDVLQLNPPLQIKLFEIATQLASAQDLSALDRIIANTPPEFDELWMQLIQDCVIRGKDVTVHPNMMALWDKFKSEKHPLTALPLTLFEPEADLYRYIKSFGVGSAGAVIAFGGLSNDENNKPTSPTMPSTIEFTEITDLDSRQMISRAVETWEQYSNGSIEARQFRTHKTVTADTLLDTDLLRRLGLDCLEGASPADVLIQLTNANDIANSLFSAGSTGGAYDRGRGSAYGRLMMWQSLAGLMNMPDDTPIDDLAKQVSQCGWLVFEAKSQWFYHVVWDIGIVVISAEGDVISVLAATDTD